MPTYTLNDLQAGYTSVAALNDNFTTIETALNSAVLQADGSVIPSADLDMNSFDINNVGNITMAQITIDGTTISSIDDLKGEKGDQGDKGDKGDQGDKGDTGPQGDVGPAGADGTNFEVDVVGLFADRSTYDSEPKGFSFLATDHVNSISIGSMFIKDSNASGDWSNAIPFGAGPEGPQGPAGADGVDGVDGQDGTDGTDGVNGTSQYYSGGRTSWSVLTANTVIPGSPVIGDQVTQYDIGTQFSETRRYSGGDSTNASNWDVVEKVENGTIAINGATNIASLDEVRGHTQAGNTYLFNGLGGFLLAADVHFLLTDIPKNTWNTIDGNSAPFVNVFDEIPDDATAIILHIRHTLTANEDFNLYATDGASTAVSTDFRHWLYAATNDNTGRIEGGSNVVIPMSNKSFRLLWSGSVSPTVSVFYKGFMRG